MDRRWIARLAVTALHLGLFAVLWLHRPPPPHDEPGGRRLTTVRLVPAQRSPSPPAPAPAPAPRAIATPHLPAPDRPAPAPLPGFRAEAAASPEPTAPADATEPPRTTLLLTLPPGHAASSAATRNPALGDPRSNTARRTLESRIADAAGNTGAWTEERTSDHRTVMRHGDTCVEVFRSRIADMDPFNGNVAPRTAGMMGKPYKCK
ncbi:MAG: hypothetical protein QM788_03070 [Roseateles sp.]|uniref:hypothetical protein n=1 Tax=Roseateles sp. TaxID=1971397 RepID=UPI0039E8DE2D